MTARTPKIPHVSAWIEANPAPLARPVLVTGKGPTFDDASDDLLAGFEVIALNQTANFGEPLLAVFNDFEAFLGCRTLPLGTAVAMAARPHWRATPAPYTLAALAGIDYRLSDLLARGMLYGFDLLTSLPNLAYPQIPPLEAKYSVSESAIEILAQAGHREIYTIGVDGGEGRSRRFRGTGHNPRSYLYQFAQIEALARRYRFKLRKASQ